MSKQTDILFLLKDTEFWPIKDLAKRCGTFVRFIEQEGVHLRRQGFIVEVDGEYAITAKGLAAIPEDYQFGNKPAPRNLVAEKLEREAEFLRRVAGVDGWLSADQLNQHCLAACRT